MDFGDEGDTFGNILAGWYAKRSRTPLVLTPVKPQIDVPFLPFVYDIAMGVRRDDPALRVELDDVLVRRRAERTANSLLKM